MPLLIDFFLKKYAKIFDKEVRELSSYAMEVLMNYDYPGNVRELENIIERGVALATSNIILPESLTLSSHRKKAAGASTGEIPENLVAVRSEEELFDEGLEKIMARFEKKLLITALEKTNYSKMRAADLLKISFRSFRYKLQKYNL